MLEKVSKSIDKYIESNEVYNTNYDMVSEPKNVIIDEIKKYNQYKMVIVAETWCGDCKRNIPKMGKILKLLKWESLVFDGADKDIRTYYNIVKIPTFIVFDNNEKEIGRIIEKNKSESLEEDLLIILKGLA